MKKIVIKVGIDCQICKTDVLKAVTKLQGIPLSASNGIVAGRPQMIGIETVAADSQKGTLTVVGNVDPVLVVRQLRKKGKAAEIVSVGPPKPSEPRPLIFVDLPSSCNQCELVGYKYVPYHQGGGCHIL